MKRLLPALILVLAACDPAPELDGGAPADDPALDGGPTSTGPVADPLADAPERADAATAPALGIAPPMGVQLVEGCETIVAADYTSPPKMDCLLFQTADREPGKLDAGILVAISEAGWKLVRSQRNEHYLERPHAGTDCADVAVISVLTDRVQAVVDHAGGGKAAAGSVWEAYAIPASTLQACGASRTPPQGGQ